MNPQDIKSKVLQQLMDAMDERMIGDLKSKSPKFAKVDIQSDDPKLADELKNKLMGEGSEEEPPESPGEALKEKMHPEMEAKEPQGEEQDPDLDKLLELYKSLK